MIIYKIINSINDKIYIGQTNGVNKFYIGGGKALKKAINKYGRDKFKRVTIVEGNFNKPLTEELERHYIQLYNSTNPKRGYNILSGPPQYLKNHKPRFSKKHRENLSLSMGIGVIQIDKKTNKEIKRFRSITQALKSLNVGIHSGGISLVCNSKRGRKTAYGYKWKYIE